MEDGGSSVQPMSTGYFPRPVEGQSLFSFLSSGQFSRANAELDRENAHFSISEAMIAAIEQVILFTFLLLFSIFICSWHCVNLSELMFSLSLSLF